MFGIGNGIANSLRAIRPLVQDVVRYLGRSWARLRGGSGTEERVERVASQRVSGNTPTSTPSPALTPPIQESPLHSVHTTAEVAILLDFHKAVELAVKFIEEGLLSQAVETLKLSGKTADDLPGSVSLEDKAWIKLKMEFVASSSLDLDAMALTASSEGGPVTGLGWGYKSANLTRLQTMADEVSHRCGCKVSVPAFLPISDKEMRSFLLKFYPKLPERWQAFLDSIPADKRASFEREGKAFALSEESLLILKDIGDHIEAVFNQRVYDTPEIREWLSRQSSEFLIIRSTGKEDSETNSNAGGNASIPFIEKDPKAISSAIGQVLSSYFGEKSVLQRISAGDKSLLNESYFLPVLVQAMVGEKVGGADCSLETLPRSGVMFTTSDEMGPGISKFYIGLGNNEGIVSSRVATDCYVLSKHSGGHRVIHDKPTRFVAVEKRATPPEHSTFSCEPVAVDGAVKQARRMPALDETMAGNLKNIADFYSEKYSRDGTPMPLDMEISIIGDQIYLLQARPLMKVDRPEPSYLRVEELEAADVTKAKTLVDGGCDVRVIDSPDQILVVDRIEEALHVYLHGGVDQAKIRTVVIREPAPGTSHEAVTLRSKGVAVMIVSDEANFNEIKTARSALRGSSFLAVDPGRGFLAKASQDISQLIQEGYFCYPMPLESSLKSTVLVESYYKLRELKDKAGVEAEREALSGIVKGQLAHLSEQRKRLTALCFRGDSQSRAATSRIPSDVPVMSHLHELVRRIGHESYEEALVSLHDAVQIAEQALKKATRISTDDRTGAEIFQMEGLLVLQNMIDVALNQIVRTVLTTEPGSLERLYPVRLLEAILFQESPDVVGGFSMVSVLESVKNEHIASSKLESLGVVIESERQLLGVPLLRVGAKILTPSTKALWEAFIPFVVEEDSPLTPAERKYFLETIQELENRGILFEWANIALRSLIQKSPPIIEASKNQVRALFKRIKELRVSYGPTMALITGKSEVIANIRKNISAWESPSYIERNIRQLKKSFEFFSGVNGGRSEFEDAYIAASPGLERLALLNLARNAVRCYDELIKSIKASKQFASDKAQAKAIYALLETYKTMSLRVIKLAETFELPLMTEDSMAFGSFATDSVHEVMRMTKGVETDRYGNLRSLDLPGLAEIPVTRLLAAEIPTSLPADCDHTTYFNAAALEACKVTIDDLRFHRGITSLDSYLEFIDKGGIYILDLKMKRSPGFANLNPERLTESAAKAAMLPSDGFNVQKTVLGNESDYDMATVWPETLEDYFTLFHQNMERVFNTLNYNNGLKEEILPPVIAHAVSQAKSMAPAADRQASIDAISMEGSELKIEYNIPLRQHSARITLGIDLSKTPPSFRFEGQFLGGEEHARWRLTAAAMSAIGRGEGSLSIPSFPSCSMTDPKSVAFKIDLHPTSVHSMNSQLLSVCGFIADMGRYSSDETAPLEYLESVNRLKRVHGIGGDGFDASTLPTSMFLYPASITKLARTAAGHAKAMSMLSELEAYVALNPSYREVGMLDSLGGPSTEVDLINLLPKRVGDPPMIHTFADLPKLREWVEALRPRVVE